MYIIYSPDIRDIPRDIPDIPRDIRDIGGDQEAIT